MPNALNTFNCAMLGANTGVGSCTVDFKNIIGSFIAPAGTISFTYEQTLTPQAFAAALQSATTNPKASRLYPIYNFGEIKDGSEAAVFEKLGYGPELPVRDGTYKFQFRIIKGGFCLSKALRMFNQMNVDVWFIDANNLVIGQTFSAGGSSVAFFGINQYSAYQEPVKFNDGSKNTMYMQNFSFPGNVFDSFGGVQLLPGMLNGIIGLQNIYLSSGGPRVANVSLVTGTVGCQSAALGDVFGSELAVADLWTLQDSVTGIFYNSSTGITSVAYSGTTKLYTITANASDPAYNSGNPVNISLTAANLLSPVIGAYESNSFTTPN